MTKSQVLNILENIKEFKDKHKAIIIDTHIHPHDVMGVFHYSEHEKILTKKDFLKPGPLELLEYGSIEKIGSKIFFTLFSGTVDRMIKDSYKHVHDEVIEKEMEVSLTDKGVLLSLDPWTPTDLVGNGYVNNKNFYILGSINIHKDKLEDIESKINSFIKNYKIIGLKLHPNLQGFKPQPKDNSREICEKLKIIYEVASKNNLYILFHAGISNYTEIIHEKYGFYPRNRTNAVLENFCDENGRSEIFENYSMPVVIAHLGHYGKIFHNYRLMKKIVESYSQVYFDTSGVSPKFLSKSLSFVPSNRIIFGSDAVYNRIAYNIAFLYEGVKNAKTNEKFDDMLLNIMGRNFQNKLVI